MTDRSAGVGSLLKAGLSSMGAARASCLAALVVAIALTVSTNFLPPEPRPLAALAAVVIAQGALFRHAFGRASGFKGLRWGRDEWRLLGANLLVLGLFLLIGSILLIVIGAIALGVARVSAPQLDVSSAEAWREALANAGPAGLFAGAAPIAALAILIWLGLRLSFTAPATVAESGVRVLSAFPLTKGKVPPLLVPGILGLPMIACLIHGVAPPRGVVFTAVSATITYLLLAPAWSGALAHLYRQSAVTQDA
ncbi:hypothetical protein [Caulobacter segnis]|uniref:hypothetical protein n=1 Tax=Caulobacter segnis TaxID=88688 RepID=UPI0028654EB1|nr:hypothetical protein [Caulobacter segnis]MDR6627960.1 hypothetical protein [Caulobacter segnis]